MKNLYKLVNNYLPLIFLLIFASLQFFLILRHKNPYLSDSYFYKHIFYQLNGLNFDQAYDRIIIQVDAQKMDNITKNIFFNKKAYVNSLTFFTKRPFYPIFAYLLNFFIKSEYLSFLIPVFLGYIGCIILIFLIVKKGLGNFFSTLITALFISFYPFLDWSTYFMTDTIGAFFWLLTLYFSYLYLNGKKKNYLKHIFFTLIISLLNREQSLLLFLLYIFLYLFYYKTNNKNLLIKIKQLTIISILITIIYQILIFFLKLPTVWNTVVYMQNSYGLTSNSYSFFETFTFLIDSVIKSHIGLVQDLIRYRWWFVFVLIGIYGIIFEIKTKKLHLIDLIVLYSGLVSYLAIYIYPMLSYRYFYPVIIMILYFSFKFMKSYFKV